MRIVSSVGILVMVICMFGMPCIRNFGNTSSDLFACAADTGETTSQLEGKLLELLGMKRRPRPKRENIVIPDFLMELYKIQTGLEVDTTSLNLRGKHTQTANTVRTFTITPDSERKSKINNARLKFDLTSLPSSEMLKAAELRVYRKQLRLSSDSENRKIRHPKQQVTISDILKFEKDGTPISRVLDTKLLFSNEEGWETFDIFPAVERWRTEPNRNFGLILEVRSVKGNIAEEEHLRVLRRRKRSASPTIWESEHPYDEAIADATWLQEQPLLVSYTDDGRAKGRTKRSADKKRRKKGKQELCRRLPLYVDFNDVKWNDWIVAPHGYNAFFCEGQCPFPLADHLNTTNHAIVQNLVNSVQPSVRAACCVPTELSSISMLYTNEFDKVVLKNYQDMVVEGCGCR